MFFFMLFLKCSGILNLVADKFSEYRKTMMFYSAFWVSSSMTARLHSSNTLLEGMTGVQFDGGDPTARKRELEAKIEAPCYCCLCEMEMLHPLSYELFRTSPFPGVKVQTGQPSAKT